MTVAKNHGKRRYAALAAAKIINFLIVATLLIAAAGIFIPKGLDWVNNTEIVPSAASGSYYEGDGSSTESGGVQSSLSDESLPPVVAFGSASYGAEKSMDAVIELFGDSGVPGDYGRFRQLLSQNVPSFMEIIGQSVTISSTSDIASDTKILFTDAESICTIDIPARTTKCDPVAG